MTSRFLQKLALCGELEARRDPVVVHLLNILRYDSVSETCVASESGFTGYTMFELQTALLDVSGIAPEVTADRLAKWTARGLFRKDFSIELNEPLYTFESNSINTAQGNPGLIIYFSPCTVFPWLLNAPSPGGSYSVSDAAFPGYKVNTRKGVTTYL